MERLGAGGTAVVYRACDERLKRDVAIKVIARGFRQDVVALRRFRREAELGALLRHPNIVSVLGAGADPHDFIVMELVRGHDVRALVRSAAGSRCRRCLTFSRRLPVGCSTRTITAWSTPTSLRATS